MNLKSPEKEKLSVFSLDPESPVNAPRSPAPDDAFSIAYNGFQNQTLLLDGKDLPTLIDEKAKLRDYLEKQVNDHDELHMGYGIYKNKIQQRERELRDNIFNISSKLKVKDAAKVTPSINELYDEVMTNVTEIKSRMKNDIFDKKKDIENRINIRLMDSEYRHKKFLDGKVKEQEITLKSLHSVTQEMARIKENYENIKTRCNNYLKENEEFRKNIVMVEGAKLKLQDELLNLKRLINIIQVNARTKTQISTSNNSQENWKNMGKTASDFGNRPYSSRMKSQKEIRPNSHINKNKNELSRLSKESLNEGLRKQQTEVVLPIHLTEIKRIKNLINDDHFCRKHPTQANIIAAMTNIVENTKIKNRKLNENLKYLAKGKNDLTERVLKVIENTKNNPLNNTNLNYSKTGISYKKMESNEIFVSKEDRRRFIEAIVNDNKIKEIFCNESFPTINTSQRILPSKFQLNIKR